MPKEETLTLTIEGKNIEVFHSVDKETGSFFKDQKNGLEELKSLIKDELKKGLANNWYPYNNFECSVNWKVIK